MGSRKLKVGIIGGTGYTGVELLRELASHSAVEVALISSRGEAGRAVTEVFPALRGVYDSLIFSEPDAAACDGLDVVFFATPHATSMAMVPALLDRNICVIDLSADFRIRDAALWSEWYGVEHSCPELLPEAVYGLPEMNREALASANLIACAGCYPTAIALGYMPLLRRGVVDPGTLIADAKSGASGAGRKASVPTLFSETAENFRAYGAGGHRHLPEIRQSLGDSYGQPVDPVFVPHLVPMVRGIHATLYASLTAHDLDLQQLYLDFYQNEPFVDVMPAGSHPETRSVRGANTCRIAVHRPGDGDRVVVLSVIDNLVKGASGQAIQCMNIRFGLEETAGLDSIGLTP